MATRGQLREQTYGHLKETEANSNFTPEQINLYLNISQRYLGTLCEYPRDIVSVSGDSSAESYTLPSDFLFMRMAWFGDSSVEGDIDELDIVSDKTLSFMYPNWLENTDKVRGKPLYASILDHTSFIVYPKVSAEFNGKPISFSYCFSPRPMSVDTDEPQLPISFHDGLPLYACHLCYLPLGGDVNQGMAEYFYKKFNGFWKSIESTSTKESDSARNFEWQVEADL